MSTQAKVKRMKMATKAVRLTIYLCDEHARTIPEAGSDPRVKDVPRSDDRGFCLICWFDRERE